MFRKYYTDEAVIEATAKVKSIAGLLRKLGLKPRGGNYQTVKRLIIRLNLDTAHWTGQGWNKGQSLKEIGSYSNPWRTKKALAKKRGWACEICERTFWRDQPIPLECHHLDKDRTNNSEENLQLVCRNCHFVLHGRK